MVVSNPPFWRMSGNETRLIALIGLSPKHSETTEMSTESKCKFGWREKNRCIAPKIENIASMTVSNATHGRISRNAQLTTACLQLNVSHLFVFVSPSRPLLKHRFILSSLGIRLRCGFWQKQNCIDLA